MGYQNIKRMGGLFPGGGPIARSTVPPAAKAPPAVRTDATARGRTSAMDARRRQARAGQSSMRAGGYSAGGSGGKTLMGA